MKRTLKLREKQNRKKKKKKKLKPKKIEKVHRIREMVILLENESFFSKRERFVPRLPLAPDRDHLHVDGAAGNRIPEMV
jgi:hypothetical protein